MSDLIWLSDAELFECLPRDAHITVKQVAGSKNEFVGHLGGVVPARKFDLRHVFRAADP